MATEQSLNIHQLNLTGLFRHEDGKGVVRHFMRSDFPTFNGFGEVYFSTVHYDLVKGWKKHHQMLMNLTVVNGIVEFVLFDDRENSPTKGKIQELLLDAKSPQLLTVPPGVWMAFKGIHPEQTNILANFADIEHKPDEATNIDIDSPLIPYNWSSRCHKTN